MTKDEKELFKFVSEPKYRTKVLSKLKKEEDKRYQNKVQSAKEERLRLVNLRQQEINNIENSRWEIYANGNLRINWVEGCVLINNNKVLFSSIKGAELNEIDGFRTVTTETSTTKKNPSIGGAVAGGLIGGKAGAAIGGAGLNKARTTTHAYTKSIPTCNHIGVVIDVDGFKQEVIVINLEIDQSSNAYISAHNEAQHIIMRLREASNTPVPQSFIPSNKMQSVKEIEKQIDGSNERLNIVINERPTYQIPSIYRTKEQIHMSDQEYLNYLQEQDSKRLSVQKTDTNSSSESGALCIASMVLGIIGLLLTVVLFGIIPSIAGLVLGIVSLVTKKPKTGFAIAGVSISSIAIILFFVLLTAIM